MLTYYQQQVQRLLHDPKNVYFPVADVTSYINTARGQIAGEGECIRTLVTLTATTGNRVYSFASLSATTTANGIQAVMHVRSIRRTSGSGYIYINPRAWEWFELYHLSVAAPVNAAPTTWSQYGQGAAADNTTTMVTSGSLYLDPPPDVVYTLNCDCICYPIALADDTTKEAIPYPWTDCVPYYAAYLAFYDSQRMQDAQVMWEQYQTFINRARMAANPSVNRNIYEQSSSQFIPTRFQVSPPVGGQQGGGRGG